MIDHYLYKFSFSVFNLALDHIIKEFHSISGVALRFWNLQFDLLRCPVSISGRGVIQSHASSRTRTSCTSDLGTAAHGFLTDFDGPILYFCIIIDHGQLRRWLLYYENGLALLSSFLIHLPSASHHISVRPDWPSAFLRAILWLRSLIIGFE